MAAHRNVRFAGLAVSALLSATSCGGQSSTDESTGASGGSAGVGAGSSGAGASSSGSGGTTGGAAGSSGSGGTSTSDAGGRFGAGGSSACALDSSKPCAERTHVECLAAFPDCVPVYDDRCCSTCNSSACADCFDWHFYECVPLAESSCAGVSRCGLTPDWACRGGQADCSFSAARNIGKPCGGIPGCVEYRFRQCPAGACCKSLTSRSCGCTTCGESPPTCAGGFVPETDGQCFTGDFISAEACGG